MITVPGPPVTPKPDRATIDAVLPALRQQIGVLDSAVARTGYLVDEQFTFADINLLPILYRGRQAPEGAEAVAAAPHLSRYYDQHAARPSFQRTTPPDGPPRRQPPRCDDPVAVNHHCRYRLSRAIFSTSCGGTPPIAHCVGISMCRPRTCSTASKESMNSRNSTMRPFRNRRKWANTV